MKRKVLRIFLAAALMLFFSGISAPAVLSGSSGPMLKMVFIEVDSPHYARKLAGMGFDIAGIREMKDAAGKKSYRIEAVVSARDEIKLKKAGIKWQAAQKAMQLSQRTATMSVYHSFDEPELGIKDRLYKVAADYPELVQMESIGTSYQGRPLLALKLTANPDCKGGKGKGKHKGHGKHGKKARVLFLATHHAREWVATQTAMRLIDYLVENYGSFQRVTDLLNTVEVWIIPVANPDGYEYTFTHERLWRKNLRDNDGDGEITEADGVDLNRNFDAHWGLDEEGSSGNMYDMTYRGPAPDSEPETQAVTKFVKKKKFKYVISYHTYGDLILYPLSWQVKTASFDDPIFVAQAGTDENPAIWDSVLDQGYDPGVGADLYITNGDFTDWCYETAGIASHTVEVTFGYDEADNYYGFEYPDDEGMVQTVFEDNLEFALAVAESAADPAHPVSPVGMPAGDAYHSPVADSYGSDQMINVLARKKNKLKLYYSLNGGKWKKSGFRKITGDFYNQKPGLYYKQFQAMIKNQQPGDEVIYKIKAGKDVIGPYSYTVSAANGGPVLVLAAEDYTGANTYDPPLSAPLYLSYYTEALDAAGYPYSVWDVDQQGVPSYTEVLSHYDAVIWYTGDSYAPSAPVGDLGVHEAEVFALREFLNYSNGRLFATGQDLAWLSSVYGLFPDDFFQYYLGAYTHIESGGMDQDTDLPYPVLGEVGDPVFDGLSFNLTGGDGAGNQAYADTFLPTNHFLPHFDTTLAARYDRPGGPFEPHSGDYYVYSQMSDMAFKRLGGTFDLPAVSPKLTFWISYDIEADWDYAFVEISVAGSNVWTTLPDENGLTTTGTGESCDSGWVDQIHPFLEHYMDTDCNPVGTTGEWHAFTANSGGWKQVEMDLSAYAGQTVEIHISYATDWGTQNLGAFVDDIMLAGYPLEDFESGMGDWSVSVAPGSAALNNWERITGAGFPEGPAILTPYSVYLGFGLEGIDTAENRSDVMGRVLDYLLE